MADVRWEAEIQDSSYYQKNYEQHVFDEIPQSQRHQEPWRIEMPSYSSYSPVTSFGLSPPPRPPDEPPWQLRHSPLPNFLANEQRNPLQFPEYDVYQPTQIPTTHLSDQTYLQQHHNSLSHASSPQHYSYTESFSLNFHAQSQPHWCPQPLEPHLTPYSAQFSSLPTHRRSNTVHASEYQNQTISSFPIPSPYAFPQQNWDEHHNTGNVEHIRQHNDEIAEIFKKGRKDINAILKDHGDKMEAIIRKICENIQEEENGYKEEEHGESSSFVSEGKSVDHLVDHHEFTEMAPGESSSNINSDDLVDMLPGQNSSVKSDDNVSGNKSEVFDEIKINECLGSSKKTGSGIHFELPKDVFNVTVKVDNQEEQSTNFEKMEKLFRSVELVDKPGLEKVCNEQGIIENNGVFDDDSILYDDKEFMKDDVEFDEKIACAYEKCIRGDDHRTPTVEKSNNKLLSLDSIESRVDSSMENDYKVLDETLIEVIQLDMGKTFTLALPKHKASDEISASFRILSEGTCDIYQEKIASQDHTNCFRSHSNIYPFNWKGLSHQWDYLWCTDIVTNDDKTNSFMCMARKSSPVVFSSQGLDIRNAGFDCWETMDSMIKFVVMQMLYEGNKKRLNNGNMELTVLRFVRNFETINNLCNVMNDDMERPIRKTKLMGFTRFHSKLYTEFVSEGNLFEGITDKLKDIPSYIYHFDPGENKGIMFFPTESQHRPELQASYKIDPLSSALQRIVLLLKKINYPDWSKLQNVLEYYSQDTDYTRVKSHYHLEGKVDFQAVGNVMNLVWGSKERKGKG